MCRSEQGLPLHPADAPRGHPPRGRACGGSPNFLSLSGEHRDAVFDHLMATLDVRRDIGQPARRGEIRVAENETRRYLLLHWLLESLGFVRGESVELRLPDEDLRLIFLSLQQDAAILTTTGSPQEREQAQPLLAASKAVLVEIDLRRRQKRTITRPDLP